MFHFPVNFVVNKRKHSSYMVHYSSYCWPISYRVLYPNSLIFTLCLYFVINIMKLMSPCFMPSLPQLAWDPRCNHRLHLHASEAISDYYCHYGFRIPIEFDHCVDCVNVKFALCSCVDPLEERHLIYTFSFKTRSKLIGHEM